METSISKKSIIQKTVQVGSSTIISKFLGIIREILLMNYLGPGIVADAFVTAFKIPNSLRKIFAEGAVSASFVPTMVTIVKAGDKQSINSLMTRSFLVIEGILILLCTIIFFAADKVIRFITPGWFTAGHDIALGWFSIPGAWLGYGEPLPQVLLATTFLRILIAFIVFISSSALLAAALQSVNHFLIPAFSPVLLNVFFIGGVLIGWYFNYSPELLCFFILIGGFVQFVLHLVAYNKYHFGFTMQRDPQADLYFKQVLGKFLPCLFSISMMEICLFIDTSFASYLPAGFVGIISIAHRFMAIALSVFAVAFSTVLLPHFSRVSTYAPKRLSFYLLEATKLVFWITLPVVIVMSFFADKIFSTLFKTYSETQVYESASILNAFLVGLFFFSLNKILLNIYYAFHNTRIPGIISFVAVLINILLNKILMGYYQGTGLALATSIAAIVQTILFIIILNQYFNIRFYGSLFVDFAWRYCLQLVGIFSLFWVVYCALLQSISTILSGAALNFFINEVGFWLWVGPLCALAFGVIMYVRKRSKLQIYFLD